MISFNYNTGARVSFKGEVMCLPILAYPLPSKIVLIVWLTIVGLGGDQYQKTSIRTSSVLLLFLNECRLENEEYFTLKSTDLLYIINPYVRVI
jgi:hypothetical protein